jgi:hypothetical protein
VKTNILLAAALAAVLAAPGCVFLAGAAIGAGVVHVVGEDSTEVVVEQSYESVFDASKEELNTKGVVEASDVDAGLVQGSVGSSSVKITVTRETAGSVRITIKARKNGGISPDPDTAEQISYGVLRRTG